MKRTIIELTNNFHGTTARVTVINGKISNASIKRAGKKLCGIPGCTCGDIRGNEGDNDLLRYNPDCDEYTVA